MLVLGLQGSPRKKGNTVSILRAFLDEAERLGARTRQLDAAKMNIAPCRECGTCDRKGFCPLEDDMQEVYHLLWKADVVVMATPIFFYGPTAQLKALIDRSQAVWARKYTHKLTDPGRNWRKGCLLAVGATRGKNLFEGTEMAAKYFFDAVGAHFEGTLGYRKIEHPGDIDHHPTALEDARKKAAELVGPQLERKRVLFVCRENACRSQMAGAFARFHFGDRLDVESAGSAPAEKVNPLMVEAMGEKGIDMAYRKPASLDAVQKDFSPELMVSMGCEDACPLFPGARAEEWDIPDPAEKGIAFMREIRDSVEKKVNALFADTVG